VIAEYDENDSLVAKYVYGPELDEPVRLTRGGEDYYYHAAALGTVTEMTDRSGGLVERYRYDVYGEPQMWDGSGSRISNSQIGNRLLFQGRDRDPDTGLYNFRNRYYSPGLGRFVQVDPIRSGASYDLHNFAANNPISRSDPLGLCDCKDPCGDAQKGRLDKDKGVQSGAGVICCGGKKYACVWQVGDTSSTGGNILQTCATEHEKCHFNDVDCSDPSCKGKPLCRPPFKDPSQAKENECRCYDVEINCLKSGNCGGDAQCEDRVQKRIGALYKEKSRRGCTSGQE
jgi:RHS repeat-associated protein